MSNQNLTDTEIMHQIKAQFAAHRPRISAPRYAHLDTTDKINRRIDALSPLLDMAVLDHPHVLFDPAAFYRLAVAQGYPHRAKTRTGQMNLGRDLIREWRLLSPATAMEAETRIGDDQTRLEPFRPGWMRQMRDALAPIRDHLGFELFRRPEAEDDEFAFFALCIELGYDGPGARHDATTPNDFNRAIGRRLRAVWALVLAD